MTDIRQLASTTANAHDRIDTKFDKDSMRVNVGANGSTGGSFNNLSVAWPVTANNPKLGTAYRLKVFGFGKQGSTAQLCSIRVNAFGQQVASGFGALAVPANAVFWWDVEAVVTVVSTGVTGTGWLYLRGVVSPVTRAGDPAAAFPPFPFAAVSVGGGSTGAVVTIDTTTAATVLVDAAWGSATGSPVITGASSTFERLGT